MKHRIFKLSWRDLIMDLNECTEEEYNSMSVIDINNILEKYGCRTYKSIGIEVIDEALFINMLLASPTELLLSIAIDNE